MVGERGVASDPIRQAVEETIARFQVPGMVVLARRGGGERAALVCGRDAAGRPLERSSLFPVASITKLATALAVLRLVDAGAFALDDPLTRVLPDAAAARDGITVRTLLCHISGLPIDPDGFDQLYAPGLDRSALAEACLRTVPRWPAGTRVQYSNVGYGLLAVLVERQTGLAFPTALRALVLGPLGIEGYLGEEPPRPSVYLADVRGAQAGTPLEPFTTPFWRSLALPWAGLLTTADGALALLQAFQGVPVGFLRLETLAEATRDQTDALSGGYTPPLIWPRCPWGLGPELRDAKRPHWAPEAAAPDSFGHAGASGAVVWADPPSDAAWVILGARTAENGWLVRGAPAIGAAIIGAP